MTAQITNDALTTALRPYALTSVADHLRDFDLTAVSIHLDNRGVTIYLHSIDVDDWRAHADFGETTSDVRTSYTAHTADATLHGSCVNVRLRWIIRHERCEGDAGQCGAAVEPIDSPRRPGCPHGRPLCSQHKSECEECVDVFRQAFTDRDMS